MSRIVLASASPRRKELLEKIGMEFEICPAKGEEMITKEAPSLDLEYPKRRETDCLHTARR